MKIYNKRISFNQRRLKLNCYVFHQSKRKFVLEIYAGRIRWPVQLLSCHSTEVTRFVHQNICFMWDHSSWESMYPLRIYVNERYVLAALGLTFVKRKWRPHRIKAIHSPLCSARTILKLKPFMKWCKCYYAKYSQCLQRKLLAYLDNTKLPLSNKR